MYLILLQTQTASSAAFEIILMLLGAAAIGAYTTYFYYKSKYTREISLLKTELAKTRKMHVKMKKEIEGIKNELAHNNEQIDQLGRDYNESRSENEKLKKVYEASQELYLKAVSEAEEANKLLKNRGNELKEKDSILVRIANRKHLLDYDSFGRADFRKKDKLQMISGIGPFIEEKLNMLDIYTFKQISKFRDNDIETVNEAIEFFPGRIERDEWVAQAKELVFSNGKKSKLLENIKKRKGQINYDRIGMAHEEDADDLTVISGIGGWMQQKLNALDIYTLQQIANFSQEDEQIVSEIIGVFPGRIDRDEWVPQAQELIYSKGKKTDLFERMKMKKHKIDYSVIGIAHKEDAQDLTQIHGIGPFIEKKLNFLGIYTFKQISRFTKQDIETVSEIIEFFPGRIERDNWVAQAKTLALTATSEYA